MRLDWKVEGEEEDRDGRTMGRKILWAREWRARDVRRSRRAVETAVKWDQ